MKKFLYLILYLINFFLTFFIFSTVSLGIQKNALIGSIIFLLIIGIIFLLLTILFYKLYKKAKNNQNK